ncbi:hypothetical protein LshimejAT787_2500480 [Lyophyllum shimeji]|uniref:Uncharacterized protein n=1 Tax=Lyophyllum shimeji TaxID=47721 RepID=A0A9P3UX04_LYOSH|nr:hypothetical protein LshimejAT787_2500480 [Lyophyllum shimeji]
MGNAPKGSWGAAWAPPVHDTATAEAQPSRKRAMSASAQAQNTSKKTKNNATSKREQGPRHSEPRWRLAPIILSDDEDNPANDADDISTEHQEHQLPPRRRGKEVDFARSRDPQPPQASNDDADADASLEQENQFEVSEDEVEFDDGAEDLRHLDAQTLKHTILAERVQFTQRTRKSSTPIAEDLFNHDALDNRRVEDIESDGIPTTDMDLTTASSLNGDDDRPSDEDHPNGDSDLGLDELEPELSTAVSKRKKGGKREQARLTEVPQWANRARSVSDKKTHRCQPIKVEPTSDAEIDFEERCYDANLGWPSAAHYVPPSPTARVISLRAQPAALHRVIKAGIRQITEDSLFKTAYLSVEDNFSYQRGTLENCARKQGGVRKKIKDIGSNFLLRGLMRQPTNHVT